MRLLLRRDARMRGCVPRPLLALIGAVAVAVGSFGAAAHAEPPAADPASDVTALASSAGCGSAPTMASGTHSIQVGGTNRSFILRVPDNYDSSRAYPLIFGFHWNGGTAGDVSGGKCLDAEGAATAPGTRAIIWDCHGGANQKWNANPDGTITNVQSGLCLEATGNRTANGTKVVLWTCNGGANQRWTLGALFRMPRRGESVQLIRVTGRHDGERAIAHTVNWRILDTGDRRPLDRMSRALVLNGALGRAREPHDPV